MASTNILEAVLKFGVESINRCESLKAQKNGWRDEGYLAARLRDANERRATQKYPKKLSVKATYPGNKQPNTVWKIDGIAKFNSTQHMLTWHDLQTGQETGERVSVVTYFKRRYNVTIQYPQLPMVRMTKKMKCEPIHFPMEMLSITIFQRYGAKLNEIQTANMIQFAVSPPAVRQAPIGDGEAWLNWGQDQCIRQYGLQISNGNISTQARVLPPPGVKLSRNRVDQSGTTGRWDLRGRQFFPPNPGILTSWGISIFEGRTRLNQGQIEKFAADFAKTYRGYSGNISNDLPQIMTLRADAGVAVNDLHQATSNKLQKRPELLVFLLQDKSSFHYERIKKF